MFLQNEGDAEGTLLYNLCKCLYWIAAMTFSYTKNTIPPDIWKKAQACEHSVFSRATRNGVRTDRRVNRGVAPRQKLRAPSSRAT